MAQRLRTVAAPAQDPGWFPVPTLGSSPLVAIPQLRISSTLFWPLQVLHTCGAHTNK